jgi:hypothetical protein
MYLNQQTWSTLLWISRFLASSDSVAQPGTLFFIAFFLPSTFPSPPFPSTFSLFSPFSAAAVASPFSADVSPFSVGFFFPLPSFGFLADVFFFFLSPSPAWSKQLVNYKIYKSQF